ncbi:MAG: alpha-L-rhamnosidase, partial [Clostridia bacterium]|nr:alpha-L-rhamnosidase [Clostridia bacterium]
HYGDWLAMDAGTDSYDGATSHDLIASAFFAYSTSLLIKTGEALNKDIEEYRVLHKNIRAAFREYFMENGMPKDKIAKGEEIATSAGLSQPPKTKSGCGMTQTAIVLILHFDLCEECERKALAEKLVEMIHQAGDIMATGFIGTPYLLHVLSDNDYTELAYKLLMNEGVPSWLYSVNHGATTMWEHWNGLKEDGSFWSTEMNSFNHYAYGSVFDWIFGVSCGIKPILPAYKEISINPHPDKRLGFADVSLKTRNGEIFASWYYKGDTVYYEFDIPDQITATITLPSGYKETVGGGKYCYAE